MAGNFGIPYGKPKIKIGYGSALGKVKRNIRQRTQKGGLRVRKQFGYGKGK